MSKPQSGISYNPAICRRCGDTVESTAQHQFASCSCGALAVDGGLAYMRRLGDRDDWAELSGTAEATQVVAEFTTMFAAGTQEEADALLDRVFDAVHEAVCPPGDAQFQPCGWCNGTVSNPADTAGEVVDDGDAWAPGRPCVVCAGTPHPGQELPCGREHVEVGTVHTDGAWITTGDRVNLHVLRDIVTALDRGNVEEARRVAVGEIDDFTDGVDSHHDNAAEPPPADNSERDGAVTETINECVRAVEAIRNYVYGPGGVTDEEHELFDRVIAALKTVGDRK